MKLQEFIEAFNGRYIDFDGAYGAQCFDLFHYYNVQVLGLSDGSILAAPAAKDIYNNFENLKGHDYFERIPNTPTGVPNEGDVVIWGNGTWGHVAVFVEGNANSFRSFDQNFPTGSPCHIQNHTTYTGVSGWLRFKTSSIPVTPALQECLTQHTQLVDQCNKKDAEINRLNNIQAEMQNDIDGFKSQIQHYTDYEKQLAITLNCEIDEAKILGEITKMIGTGDQLREALKNNESLKSAEATLTTQLGQEKTRADNAILQNQTVSDELQKATDNVTELTRKLEESKNEYLPLFNILGLTICRRK